jgi:hypothetical protein
MTCVGQCGKLFDYGANVGPGTTTRPLLRVRPASIRSVESYILIIRYFIRLLSRIPTYIRPHLTELIDVVFALDWFKYDEATLLHYSEFLLNLNSAHGGAFLDKTFATLIDTFRARTTVVNGTLSNASFILELPLTPSGARIHFVIISQAEQFPPQRRIWMVFSTSFIRHCRKFFG